MSLLLDFFNSNKKKITFVDFVLTIPPPPPSRDSRPTLPIHPTHCEAKVYSAYVEKIIQTVGIGSLETL